MSRPAVKRAPAHPGARRQRPPPPSKPALAEFGATPAVVRCAVAGELLRLRREMAERSVEAFCRLFLAERFTVPFAPLHREMMRVMDWLRERSRIRYALAYPPGHGKTSVLSVGSCLWLLAVHRFEHIVIACADEEAATELITEFGLELGGNDELVREFPHVRAKSSGAGNEIVTAGGQRIAAVVAGERLMGRRRIGPRPRLLICDEVESHRRRDYWADWRRVGIQAGAFREWLDSVIERRLHPDGNVVVVGSIPADDSLLADLVDPDRDFEWFKHARPALERDAGSPLWERFETIAGRHAGQPGELFGEEGARRFFEEHKQELIATRRAAWPEKFDECALWFIREEERRSSRHDNPFESRYQAHPLRIEAAMSHLHRSRREAPNEEFERRYADRQFPQLDWRPCGDEHDATTFHTFNIEHDERFVLAYEPGHVPDPERRRAPPFVCVGTHLATGDKRVAPILHDRRRIHSRYVIERYWEFVKNHAHI